QPPLYYLLGALLVGGIDLSDADSLLWANPQANIGDPMNPGNKNVYIHPPEQHFPWHGAVLAVHVLRFFSLLLGATTVFLTWAIVRLIFADQPLLALAVAATAAFIPQFVFITSTVNNDNLMTCLATLALYLILKQLKVTGCRPSVANGTHHASRFTHHVSRITSHVSRITSYVSRLTHHVSHFTPHAPWLILGIVLGMAMLSKLTALALLALVGMAIALLAWHARSWRAFWRMGLLVVLPAVVISGWWYLRNVRLYGEPTGLTAMWEVVGRRQDFGVDLWGEFRGLRYSFWGLFGWFSLAMPGWIVRLLDLFSLLALAGGIIAFGRWVRFGPNAIYSPARGAWAALRYREPEWGAAYRPLALLFLALWMGVVFVALVRWTSLTEGSQGRLLFPAIVSFGLFFVSGMRTWFLPRVRDAASLILVLALFALAAAAPWLWIAPAYALPAQLAALPEGAVPQDVRFGEAIVLRGVGFEQDWVRPGDAFAVTLYWQTSRSLAGEAERIVWLRLLDAVGQGIGLEDSYPGSGTLPTSLWPVGPVLAGRQVVRVGTDTDAPLVARLDLGLYDEQSGERLRAAGDLLTIGRVKVVPRRWPEFDRRQRIAVFDAGDQPGSVWLAAEFTADHRSAKAGALYPAVKAGQSLPLTLTWQVQAPPGRNYTVFVHLQDEAGQVVGYDDGVPRGGNYPTQYWADREVIVDGRLLPVGADLPAGRYWVRAGLYDEAGRVAAYRTAGERWPNDAVDLGVIEVE
ncbi:MAG: hypothetical protein JXA89_12060, partial [Anaerolineae bacterium]|nr:hypothetical protein [Anaerolineae bacterium]